MKLSTLALLSFLGFFTSLYAENQHMHPQNEPMSSSTQSMSPTLPGSCEIEIINRSYDDVWVNGVFDDGINLVPFKVYSFGYPQYISLFYYGYCHEGMNLYIDTYYGQPVFSGFVSRYSSIRIVPDYYGSKQLKADIQSK